MQVLTQIALGSAILLLCTSTHLIVGWRIILFVRRSKQLAGTPAPAELLRTISIFVTALLLSHTLHIYFWAAALWLMGALPGYEQPLYFSLVTYTTLGYGDVTLGVDHRIFGAMAAACGILMFGITTAFVVGFLTRVMGGKLD
ncbi:MAG: ion channel [Aestuariivita sp.]|uniref:ion channel n=1 Tax=Aestuariivita sp. TaxID=1872407 RepID=UPI003BAF15E2